MTILGQQALLNDADTAGRFLACRFCGTNVEYEGIRSLDKYIGSCNGSVEVDADGDPVFEPGGYTEYGDSVRELGFECNTCDHFSRTVNGLVEWRVEAE